MSNIRVDVIGFDKLTDQLKKLADDKDKKRETLAILRMVARPTVQSAKQFAPISRKEHTVSGSRTKKVIQPGPSGSLGPDCGCIWQLVRSPSSGLCARTH